MTKKKFGRDAALKRCCKLRGDRLRIDMLVQIRPFEDWNKPRNDSISQPFKLALCIAPIFVFLDLLLGNIKEAPANFISRFAEIVLQQKLR